MSHSIPQVEVLNTGFSVHTKPFHANHHDGLRHYLFRLQVEGNCRAWMNGYWHDIAPGDLLLYKPGDSYELIIDYNNTHKNQQTGLKSVDYHIFSCGDWINQWWKRNRLPRKINIGLDSSIISIWRQIAREKRRGYDRNEQILESLAIALYLSLERIIKDSYSLRQRGQSFLPYQMKDYIEKHASDHITLNQVANCVDLSVSRASQLFKDTFKQSIMNYANEIRLEIVRERILYSGTSLEQVAEMSGFKSYTHFSRSFRSRFGVSPREYKQRYAVSVRKYASGK